MMTDANVTNDRDEGFFSTMSPAAARQQLRVSLAVAGAFLAAAVLALAAGSFRPVHTEQAAVKLTIEMPAPHYTRQANVPAPGRQGG